jgi:hypothetical protein
MAGLNSLISDTGVKTTSMPSWYDAAQQQAVTGATSAFGTAPSLQNTVAGQAINTLQGPNNPFTQAQGTLQQISSGAANPWITNPTTGQVTPNTNTAMGGLFEAQNQQLQQILPDIQAKSTAAGIGAGQFGSLRSETARDKAVGDAQANLLTAQMQAALQNQQTGSQAAANLGTVGNQGITAATNVGQLQQSDPYANSAALTKILGGLNVGNTVTSATQYSPLAQVTALGSGMQGGLNALNATKTGADLLKSLGLSGLASNAKNLISGGSTGVSMGDGTMKYPLEGGGNLILNSDGSQIITDAAGKTSFYDQGGNWYDPTGPDIIPDSSGPLSDVGSNTDWIDNYDWDSLF